MRSNEEHIDQLTTRQYWEYEDSLEDLLDGWRACLKLRLEKEEADINNRLYRLGEGNDEVDTIESI